VIDAQAGYIGHSLRRDYFFHGHLLRAPERSFMSSNAHIRALLSAIFDQFIPDKPLTHTTRTFYAIMSQ
jgi:hypothetical protein